MYFYTLVLKLTIERGFRLSVFGDVGGVSYLCLLVLHGFLGSEFG